MKKFIICGNDQLSTAAEEAGEILRRGGVVIYPTDTVYGLGGFVRHEDALRRIFTIKGRQCSMPLPAMIADMDDLAGLALNVPDPAWRMMQEFWPGALTVILPALPHLSKILLGGGDSVGIRMPESLLCREIVRQSGGPVVTTSANYSGEPAVTTIADLPQSLIQSVDFVIDAGTIKSGTPSTVVDCAGGRPVLKRVGSVSGEALQKIVPDMQMPL